MKNRKIIYLVLIILSVVFSIDKVNAASEMLCKYSKGKKSVYLYCTDTSISKCKATFVEKSGNEYTFKMTNVNKIEFGTDDTCPTYANKDTNGFKFGKGWFGATYDADGEVYNSKYTSWNLSGSEESISAGRVTYNIDYNSFGYLSFTSSGAGNSIIITDFNGSKPSFNKDILDNKGKLQFDTKSGSKDNSVDSNSDGSGNNSSSNGSNSSGNNSSTSSNGGSSNSSSDSNTNNTLGVGGYCVYKNLGQCAGDDGDINGDCGAFSNDSSGKLSSYFARSKYAVFKYSSSSADSFESVYLPKYIISKKDTYVIDSSLENKVSSNFNSFDGSVSKLNSLLKDFNSFSKNQLSVLNSYNASSDKVNGCPLWFSNINGASGYDYEDSIYFYQYYNTDPEENTNTDNPDIVSSGVVIDAGEGPYYCIYDGTYGSVNTKTGSLALFYDPDNSKLKLLSYDFDYAYLNATCSLDDCATVGNVKFVGYGGYESNDGSFQNNFITATTGTCPKQINYNYNKGILTICKDESDECINGGGGILGTINRFSNSYDKDSANSSVDINSCEDLISEDLRKILNKYFTLFKIIVPILVIVLGTVDFAKAVFSNDDDMKKTQKTFIKRIIIAVAIFFIPTFVNLLMDAANTVWGWNAGTCDIEKNVDE